MFGISINGSKKSSKEEAKIRLERNISMEKNLNQEVIQVDEDIQNALKEQKVLLEQLNNMVVELKKLRNSGLQLKKIKEYMPVVVSQKKITIQKETIEIIRNTDKYTQDVHQHIAIIDVEIEKVRQRVQSYINSFTQLLKLRNIKEYDDVKTSFNQLLDRYMPQIVFTDESENNLEENDLDFLEELSITKDNTDLNKLDLIDEQLDEQLNQELSEQYRGQIEEQFSVKNKEKNGTSLSQVAAGLDDVKSKKSALNEHSILYAEHDIEVANLLKNQLERYGFKVTYAADGRQALDYINNMLTPEIVLLNMNLPYYDGYQIINHIRINKEWYSVPIVALTSNHSKEDIASILEAGANECIENLYNPQEIIARIRRLCLAKEKAI